MTIVFAGQVSVSTTPASLSATAGAITRCKRIVFSAESTTAVRVLIQAANFSNAIVREINPSGSTGIIDEHVIDDGDGGWVFPADFNVAAASGTGKINVYGLG